MWYIWANFKMKSINIVKDTRKIFGTSSLFISKKIGERGVGVELQYWKMFAIHSVIHVPTSHHHLQVQLRFSTSGFFHQKNPLGPLIMTLDSLRYSILRTNPHIFRIRGNKFFAKLEQNSQLLLQLHTYILFFEEFSVPLKVAKKLISATIKTY